MMWVLGSVGFERLLHCVPVDSNTSLSSFALLEVGGLLINRDPWNSSPASERGDLSLPTSISLSIDAYFLP